jgi:hypothetical protein
MGANRVFVPQEALDAWMSEQRVEVDGETMIMLPEGRRFHLRTAVRFMAELTESGDAAKLVGKVKDLEQLAALGGEHSHDSVIVGEEAYQVIEGFVGEPLADELSAPSGASLAAATRAAVGEEPSSGEIDLLARFFLSSR